MIIITIAVNITKGVNYENLTEITTRLNKTIEKCRRRFIHVIKCSKNGTQPFIFWNLDDH